MSTQPKGSTPPGRAPTTKTAQSLIAALGASGAVLAGTAVAFVFLIGSVSFTGFPTAGNEPSADPAELGTALIVPQRPAGPLPATGATATGLVAATPAASAAPEAKPKPQSDPNLGGGRAPEAPPSTVIEQQPGSGGDPSGSGGGSGSAGNDPGGGTTDPDPPDDGDGDGDGGGGGNGGGDGDGGGNGGDPDPEEVPEDASGGESGGESSVPRAGRSGTSSRRTAHGRRFVVLTGSPSLVLSRW